MKMIKKFTKLSKSMLFIIIGLMGIGLLIAIHEFGHFTFCKIFGVRTPLFSVGFGPRLWGKKIGDTVFTVAAIPLGGYVEINTSIPDTEHFYNFIKKKFSDKTDYYDRNYDSIVEYLQQLTSQSLDSKPYYQKILVLLGGILFNLFFAYLILIIVFLFFIRAPSTVIKKVITDSAAEKSNLQFNDKILTINNIDIGNNTEKLLELIKPLAGKEVILLIERNGKQQEIHLVLDTKTPSGESSGSLGIIFHTNKLPEFSFINALKKGIEQTNNLIILTTKSFKDIFRQRNIQQLGGPMLLISTTTKSAGIGLQVFLVVLAMLSINIAIFNLIPLPILDGGQVLFYTIEAITQRQIPLKIKKYTHLISWLIILLLIAYLSYKDILRIKKTSSAK